MKYFYILNQLRLKSSEAIIAQSGINHGALAKHLRQRFAGPVSEGGLLQEPLIEGAHPFEAADHTLNDLSKNLLHPRFIQALDELDEDHEYRFPRNRKPFRHQLATWQLLCESSPRSVLVTSGTGSGKTECFLFPILSDLVAQAESKSSQLTGVQAIMLYPLNALIASQRERLSSWTQPFKGKVRYCLYNGDLPQDAKDSERRRTPEQVIDREQLRASPPQILVTNITMLEYMLVRQEDQSIIKASAGKLKWIVLDEAHSLVGAAAAEIALLLRRVMLAFEVDPAHVRFIATSATIGQGADVKAGLQKFLADVAGIPNATVMVVEGHRKLPERPMHSIPIQDEDITKANSERLYELLGGNQECWKLVEKLHVEALTLDEFGGAAHSLGCSPAELVSMLSRAARQTAEGEQRLVPIRLHAFERAVSGIWSCINPECDERPEGWSFGRIFMERAEHCTCCRAPVLELVSCNSCGEVLLQGKESDRKRILYAPARNPPRDEFAFDSTPEPEEIDPEAEAESDPEDISLEIDRLFAANPTSKARRLYLAPEEGWGVRDVPDPLHLCLLTEEAERSSACPCCTPGYGQKATLRPLRFGAPFLISNATPTLLSAVEPADGAGDLPSGGRRLLSFTDSRQGTARMSARLQMDFERNFVRSFIYHQVQNSLSSSCNVEQQIVDARKELAELEGVYASNPLPTLLGVINDKKSKCAELSRENVRGIPWQEMVNRLAGRPEVSKWITPTWQARDEEIFTDATAVANFLMLREFSRRPRRANSIETLGLARLHHTGFESALPPQAFLRRGKSVDEWRHYLEAVATFYIRGAGAIALSYRYQHWISPKAKLSSLVGPGKTADKKSKQVGWPSGHFPGHYRARPITFLVEGLSLNLDQTADRDDLDECLRAAWQQLQSVFSSDPERISYDFNKTHIAPVLSAFWCPVTRRILDRVPFGFTPYHKAGATEAQRRAIPIEMPRHPAPLLGAVDFEAARQTTAKWLMEDPLIGDLRLKSGWTNVTDRIAGFADYARSAEHSAQQDSVRLRRYEEQFKEGKINILNCSTTMEMGVDIGSVSAVMMTNVPPSIANYRQRVGRAGRRGQAAALSFTFCKDRPLDQEAFRVPQAFLKRQIAAPRVTLSSGAVVQRHVNAYLLGRFFEASSGSAMKLKIGSFFGCPTDVKVSRPLKSERPVEKFMDWLQRSATRDQMTAAIFRITENSVLQGNQLLIDETLNAVELISKKYEAEWEGLMRLARDEGMREAGKTRMSIILQRFCDDFLLSGLADRGFLPGHGFPTDVVSFLPGREYKLRDAGLEGFRQTRALGPQRSLDIAIRDYAPGSEVVLDGLVHKSAGVTLNWIRPASEENLAEVQSIRFFWRCEACGTSDTNHSMPPASCPVCGSGPIVNQEFLKPGGFSVDPRERAHSDTDVLTYVPPEDPRISVRDEVWRGLPVPELGRIRSSRDGLVYYSSAGISGHGYALCLQCGRAEAETDNFADPGDKSPLHDHKPLRIRKDVELCPGNDRSFSIKRNLALGFEIRTDVVELQPSHPMKRATANALVIALREGLAQELGIEADEMGYAAANTTNEFGGKVASLFMYDKAAGGAGFSVSFEPSMRNVLKRAEQVLNCQNPACETGCASCVLTNDAPTGTRELDRTSALQYMRDHLLLPDQLSASDCFLPDAVLSIDLADELYLYLRKAPGTTLTCFLGQGGLSAPLDEWSIKRQLAYWSFHGYTLRLALVPGSLELLSYADKLNLRDFALANSVELVEATAPTFENGAVAIAMVSDQEGQVQVWATCDESARIPGPSWGTPASHPVAMATVSLRLEHLSIKADRLLPPPGAQMRQIDRELDVLLGEFGQDTASILIEMLKACGRWPAQGIESITYQDPYVCSPLTGRLIIDTFRNLIDHSGSKESSLTIETRPPRSDKLYNDPWLISHDWRDLDVQKGTIETYGELVGMAVRVNHRDVPHGRYVRISFNDGSEALVVLDQGFGAWSLPRDVIVRHDFKANPDQQAHKLFGTNAMIKRRGVGKTYFVAIGA